MSDLDAEILALRVSGVSEREICLKLGCPLAREPVDASPGYRGSLMASAPSTNCLRGRGLFHVRGAPGGRRFWFEG
jgi:hypothetical protein